MTPETTTSPTPRKLRDLKMPSGVLGLTTSRDGQTLFAACIDGSILRVEPRSGAHETVGAHENYASSVALLGSGETIISGGYDGALGWHDAQTTGTRTPSRKVAAHDFWSWDIAVSPDGQRVASATGQYLCGGYKYEPAPEKEPSVKVFDARGDLLHALTHVPPVQSVAFSPDSRHVAAGNLMGEVRVWSVETGALVSQWTTSDFTGWGIIKGHYYTGGIFAMRFTPDGEALVVAGMGSTRDPAAGNGRQLWQRFAWREKPARKIDETRGGESGQGLMEALEFHPGGTFFAMAGRAFKAKWNAALFDTASGKLLHGLPQTGTRVTDIAFHPAGHELYLSGCKTQSKPGESKPWGRIHVYELASRVRRF